MIEDQLSVIAELTDWLNRSLELGETLSATLRVILRAVGCARGLLVVRSPAAGEAPLVAWHNLPTGWEAALGSPADLLERWLATPSGNADEFALDRPLPEWITGAAPIRIAETRVGLLLAGSGPLSAEATAWLNYLARFVGQAIRFRQMHLAAQHLGQDQAALQKIAATLTSTLQFDEILTSTVDGIQEVLNVEAASLLLLDESQGELIVKKALGDDPDWLFQYTLQVGQGLVGESMRSGQPLLVNDAASDPRFCAAVDAVTGYETRAVLCVPLLTRGQTLGAIELINKRGEPFNRHDQEVLASMAASVANAIYNARLFHQLTVANADLQASRWEALRSRNTLQALFDGITSPIYIVDRDYHLMAVNLACAQLAGVLPQSLRRSEMECGPEPAMAQELPPIHGSGHEQPSEDSLRAGLVGQLCYHALYHREEPCTACRASATLLAGRTVRWAETRPGADGRTAEWELSSYPIQDEGGQVIQAILLGQDVTERRQLEASLAQSEKLAAVGQLAAGVAHEINNPLAAIIANAQLLQREFGAGDDRRESADLIARAGDRALRVVRSLLDFARQERYEFAPTDVNASIRSALALVEHTLLTQSIELVCELAPDLPVIQASHDHLQGVWLNLLLNARDATSGPLAQIRLTSRQCGNEVHITVADNGAGIPADRLSRIFEPFFTTKEPGRGTGLGLSECHRIVRQHEGQIRVDSRLGHGSTFTVMLPVLPPKDLLRAN